MILGWLLGSRFQRLGNSLLPAPNVGKANAHLWEDGGDPLREHAPREDWELGPGCISYGLRYSGEAGGHFSYTFSRVQCGIVAPAHLTCRLVKLDLELTFGDA